MERTETEFREKEALNENGIQIKKEEEYSEFLALLNSSCEQQYVPPTCIYIKEEEIVTEDLVLKDPEDEEVDVENTDNHLPNGDTKTAEEFPHNMMEPLVQVETQECKQEWDAEEVVESNDTAGGAVSCTECGLRLPAGASLSRHALSHQLQRRLTCALCGQLCSSSVMLMRHLHSVHAVDMPPAGAPPASAPAEEAAAPPRRAKRPYVRRAAPAVAVRVRSPGERQELRCSQCSKTFHSRSRLEAHERRHQEGGLFPCMFCPKSFTREGALRTHLLKHNAMVPKKLNTPRNAKGRFIARAPPAESDDSCLSDSDESEFDYGPTGLEDTISTDESSENSDVGIESDPESIIQDHTADHRVSSAKSTVERSVSWKTVQAECSAKSIPAWSSFLPDAHDLNAPIDYFRQYFDDSLLRHIVYQSNLFSVQNNVNNPIQLTKEELEQFLGTVLYMSIYQLPRTRMYWARASRLSFVADVMSRKMWTDIKRNIHFNDNQKMPRLDDPHRDRLFKIRPLIDALLPKFQAIPVAQMLSVDEQMVPFKGQSAMKQYLPKKPNKWGYKIFVLCDTKGVIYNFEIYTGKIHSVAGCPDLGASGNIILHLAQVVQSGQNNLLYFDDWFSSVNLLVVLKKRGIHSLGTFRSNRLPGCRFSTDANLKKRGRGAFEEKEATVEGVEIRAVKWFDKRAVILGSTFASAHPVTTVQRWDSTKKTHSQVPCPSIVTLYNKFMGGVDVLDALMSYYRIFIKSRKYYHRLFFHLVDLVIVNCWLLYRRDCESLKIPHNEQNDLLEFKSSIAEALCKQGKDITKKKRGGPSTSIQTELQRKKHRGPAKSVPDRTTRTDAVGHWPQVTETRQRCKKPNCKGQSVFMCTKCNVHLCLNKRKNCFREFHE